MISSRSRHTRRSRRGSDIGEVDQGRFLNKGGGGKITVLKSCYATAAISRPSGSDCRPPIAIAIFGGSLSAFKHPASRRFVLSRRDYAHLGSARSGGVGHNPETVRKFASAVHSRRSTSHLHASYDHCSLRQEGSLFDPWGITILRW